MVEHNIVTNRKPSELVEVHLVCPPGKDTDYIIILTSEIIFCCIEYNEYIINFTTNSK